MNGINYDGDDLKTKGRAKRLSTPNPLQMLPLCISIT